jgi:hypothetical protein
MVAPYRSVHNAFIVQSGGCLTPILGGAHGARTDLIPAPPGQYYWPMGAYADGATLYVFLERFIPGGGLCGCIALDIQIARFSLPDLALVDVRPSPGPTLLPEFGSGVFTANGFHYFVGRNTPDAQHPDYQFLARVPEGADPADPVTTPWQYWNGGTSPTDTDNWSANGVNVACVPGAPGAAGTGGACPMQFQMSTLGPLTNAGPNASLWVLPRSNTSFVASAKPHDVYSNQIQTWSAPTATGPWSSPTYAQSTPAPAGGFSYSGRVFQLPGGVPTAQYSTAGPDTDRYTDTYKVVFLGPHFPYA